MDQSRAINALEPYIALSKSATSPRAAADVITQATSHANTYVFAELLHMPNIAALQTSSEYGGYYKLLQIFTWGTVTDYESTPNLPKLSSQQHQKLLLLSLLPLAQHRSNLTYAKLQAALSISDPSTLESLITTAIYANLITATLDPYHQTVSITSVAPLRDLSPGSVPALTQTLIDWSARCTETLTLLENEVAMVKGRAVTEGERKDRVDSIIEDKMAAEDDKKGKRTVGQGEDEGFEEGGDAMDLDHGSGKGRSGKKSFFDRIQR